MTRKQQAMSMLRRIIREEIDKLAMREFEIREASHVNEVSDFNDPVLVAFRAAQLRRNQDTKKAPALKPAEARKLNSQLEKIYRALNVLYVDRNRILNDMEQEAEMGGGPIADRYSDDLEKLEGKIAKLLTQRKAIEIKLAQ